jgi:hypothetical protein
MITHFYLSVKHQASVFAPQQYLKARNANDAAGAGGYRAFLKDMTKHIWQY